MHSPASALAALPGFFLRGRIARMPNRLTLPPTKRLYFTLGIVMFLVAAIFGYLWLMHRDRPLALLPAAICLVAGILHVWLASKLPN